MTLRAFGGVKFEASPYDDRYNTRGEYTGGYDVHAEVRRLYNPYKPESSPDNKQVMSALSALHQETGRTPTREEIHARTHQMTPERKGEIRKMLGDALRKDFAAANVETQEEAQHALRNPEFRTPNLKAATQSLGKEYDVYEAQRGERPLKSALTHSDLERSPRSEEMGRTPQPLSKEQERHNRADKVGQMLYHQVWEKRSDVRDQSSWKTLGINTQQEADKRLAKAEKRLAEYEQVTNRRLHNTSELRAAASSTSKWERDEKTLRSMERDGAAGWSR